MKKPKPIVMGLLVLVLLLAACTIASSLRANRLERRLQQVETAYQHLEARHKAFAVTVSNAMLRPDASPHEVSKATAEIVRESLGVPPSSITETPLTGADRNSLPPGATIK